MDRPVRLVALRCRTSDRTSRIDTLTPLIAERLSREARQIGSPQEPRTAAWSDDLRDSRGCLLEAGGQVADALNEGALPVLVASECSVALATLPTALQHRPEAMVLWLDAHGDFNTPDTSPSGYLAGMALAGACGLWDPGLGAGAVAAERVVLAGVRELDDGEREALERSDATVIGASTVETLVAVSNALERAPVFVHLDLDVLGGLAPERLFDVLEAVAGQSELVGLEVTGWEDAELALEVLEPLLEAMCEEAHVHH